MKNRVKNLEEAKEIISNFHGRKIEVVGCRGHEKTSVVGIIPMYYPKDANITDVEILTNKKRNYYFSIGAILKKKSRITSLKIGGINFKSRSMKVMCHTPRNEADWIRTARFIKLLKIKFNCDKKD